MEPIQEMLGLRVEVELELSHGIATIGEKGDLLVQLVTLRLEDFEESPLRFLVKGLHEGETLAGDRFLGLFPTSEGEQTLAGDDLKPALFALRFHIPAID